jgi:hypothetical protein
MARMARMVQVMKRMRGGSDDSAGDEEGGVGGHEWRTETLKKITGGTVLKSIKNASVDKCMDKCIKKEACVGFTIGPLIGTKKCFLYSGDVSTTMDLAKNTYLLSNRT